MDDISKQIRYQRNFQSLIPQEQERLASSKVAIVGCGGLGGYLAEEFSRLGVGHLILIDGDRIEESNLNRQIFTTEENLGNFKVDEAQKRLSKVNSQTIVETYTRWFSETDGIAMLQGADLVCDALDNASTRIELERACHKLNIPLVLAAIGGWYGMLGVSFPGDLMTSKLFGKEKTGIEKKLGNPAFAPAVIASLAVAESVKVLAGRTVTLRNRILYMDLLNMDFNQFTLGTD